MSHLKRTSAVILSVMALFASRGGAVPDAETEVQPALKGQWAGPYELDLTESGAYPETEEIAHAALLPPPSIGSNLTRVLFWHRINTPGNTCVGDPCVPGGSPGLYGRAYSFDVNRPPRVDLVAVVDPLYDDVDGSHSLFCGGQQHLSDGSLLLVGGTDRPNQCQANGCQSGLATPGFGHRLVLRLDTTTNIPTWAPIDWANQLVWEQWYPNAIALEGDVVMVGGHSGDPQAYDRFRQFVPYDPSTQTIGTITGATNLKIASLGGGTWNCASTTTLPLNDYPRLHLLKTGDVMEATGTRRDQVTQEDVPITRFFDRVAPFTCAQDEWIDADAPEVLRFGGNTVHLITRNPLTGLFVEVIYAIGGMDEHDESSCDEDYAITTSVERMVDPDPFATWESVAPLNTARGNHNAVVLLDGSILVLGGESTPTGTCTPNPCPCEGVKMAERYKPEEVFDTPAPVWKELLEQSIVRAYHSVAGLLPDGRVFLAGGVGFGGPNGSRHTVEFYSPPYSFKPRPFLKAETVPSSATYGASFFMDVKLVDSQAESAFDRVVLLRPGAATHAWDSGQRYVELIAQEFSGTWADLTLQVTTPDLAAGGHYMMPSGFYMIAVVDASHQPSYAEWTWIGS